ncbi:MAG TPA: hypothetical protein PLJ62_01060 [Thermoflexales bacterium]|nr:hypothetical protein [Thermoflexales bacterium]HQW34492.1 hypothetical protein [Thermoflexales bacterium]HQZ22392.1 hypothetical protein [Thermoflexales bacterium]HQZ98763.1 hypothetical protein [Thermoflexales bacterium]
MNTKPMLDGPKAKWHFYNANNANTRRFLVLLPCEDLDEAALANFLWMMASGTKAAVSFLALIQDWSDEPQMRLRVALISALLRESGVESSAEYARGGDWLSAIQTRRLPGDVIVCHAEQKHPDTLNGLSVKLKPLSHFFIAQRIPACELSGILRVRHVNKLTNITRWVLPLIVILITLALQMIFTRMAANWSLLARDFALGASSAIELLSVAWFSSSRGD